MDCHSRCQTFLGQCILFQVYFFFTKTKMHGFFQTCFYFGYVTVFSMTLFLVCGSIGYGAASMFVRRIYRDIKSD